MVACMWLYFRLDRRIESHIRRRLMVRGNIGASSAVRLGRRTLEVLVMFTGVLFALYLLGFNPSTAVAGLGIGGLAIAFAAQKTLENVLGGVSLIFDKVVRVGDFLKIDNTLGTIEEVGLRSTRIRTRDRSVVNIPNGHLANLSLENLSTRDKFWFHPNMRLRCDTSSAQMRSILAGLNSLLTEDPRVEPDSIHVRFLEFGASSLELEVYAYIMITDRLKFLKIQEELLLRCMEIVEAAGAHIALQAPVYVAPTSVPLSEQLRLNKSNEAQLNLGNER